jgi:hypothetical protein
VECGVGGGGGGDSIRQRGRRSPFTGDYGSYDDDSAISSLRVAAK